MKCNCYPGHSFQHICLVVGHSVLIQYKHTAQTCCLKCCLTQVLLVSPGHYVGQVLCKHVEATDLLHAMFVRCVCEMLCVLNIMFVKHHVCGISYVWDIVYETDLMLIPHYRLQPNFYSNCDSTHTTRFLFRQRFCINIVNVLVFNILKKLIPLYNSTQSNSDSTSDSDAFLLTNSNSIQSNSTSFILISNSRITFGIAKSWFLNWNRPRSDVRYSVGDLSCLISIIWDTVSVISFQ